MPAAASPLGKAGFSKALLEAARDAARALRHGTDSFARAASAGERPVYHAGYYSAFILDPDGNNIEVVNHNR